MYINKLPAATQLSEASLYANNTVLYCFAKESCKEEGKLNADLYNVALNICVALWLTANRLTLNLSNTKSMLIGSNRRLHNIS